MRLLEGGATSGAAVILLAILTAGSAVLGAAEAPGAAGPSRPLPSSAAQPPTPSLPTTTPMPGSPNPTPPGQLTVNARAWVGHGNLAFVSAGQRAAQIVDQHAGALARRDQGALTADAVAAARDQDHLAFKNAHRRLSL